MSLEESLYRFKEVKTYVGFIFTLFPIENLRQRGFQFEKHENHLTQGYRTFTLHLLDLDCRPTEIQLRQIVDENLYLEFHKVKHFQPYWIEDLSPLKLTTKIRIQENSVHTLEGNLGPQNITDGDLKIYFHLRKPFDLWALWLQCQNFLTFETKAKPDHLFNYEGKQVGLIHLGPSCFDLLIRA